MNKFEREGYQFELLTPPFSDDLMAELKAVSDDWLDGRVEKGFSLGFFDPNYLQQAAIAVIYDPEHRIVAFANDMPTGTKEVSSIDLMRHRKDAPSGIMDEVFISLFEHNKAEGYEYFNLGMAPLANVGTSEFSFIEEKIAHLFMNMAITSTASKAYGRIRRNIRRSGFLNILLIKSGPQLSLRCSKFY